MLPVRHDGEARKGRGTCSVWAELEEVELDTYSVHLEAVEVVVDTNFDQVELEVVVKVFRL
jgi:hypothetical protein